jgi:hypothetical protein
VNKLRGRFALWSLSLLCFPGASILHAQDVTQENVEIGGFYGWRSGGGFSDANGQNISLDSTGSYGGVIDVNLHNNNFKLELLFSRQRTQLANVASLDVDHLQAGVVQETGSPKARFYGSALVGATRFAPVGLYTNTRFSASLALGLKLFPTKHVGIRLEARGYLVLVDAQGGALCAGGCVAYYSGSSFWQGELTAGMMLAF